MCVGQDLTALVIVMDGRMALMERCAVLNKTRCICTHAPTPDPCDPVDLHPRVPRITRFLETTSFR